jgi:hypothetical protein
MQFCEIDLSDIVSPSSLAPFLDEIKKREKQRKRAAKKVTSLLAALHISFCWTIQSSSDYHVHQGSRDWGSKPPGYYLLTGYLVEGIQLQILVYKNCKLKFLRV